VTDLPICLVLSTGRCGSTVLSDVIAEHLIHQHVERD